MKLYSIARLAIALLMTLNFPVSTAASTSAPALDAVEPVSAKPLTTNLAQGGGVYRIYLPLVSKVVPPPATTSLYMKTTNSTTLYNLGKSYGSAGTGGVVVLDFGKPAKQGNNYGTLLFDASVTFATTPTIQIATQQFLAGWWYGYWNQGGSTISPQAQITLTVGTSNCGPSIIGDPPCVPGGDSYFPGHGREWARMVKNIKDWIASPPSYASKEFVTAGNDMEPGWNYATTTRSWVISYTNYFTSTIIRLYDFGSCDSCPYTLPDGSGCPSCTPAFTITRGDGSQVNWSWTLDDIRYVSWGALPAYPLPLIYATSGAHAYQWYGICRYSVDTYGSRMRFQGTFTQSQACQQVTCDPSLMNTPEMGWSQLWTALYNDPATRPDGRTEMLYSTDVKFYP